MTMMLSATGVLPNGIGQREHDAQADQRDADQPFAGARGERRGARLEPALEPQQPGLGAVHQPAEARLRHREPPQPARQPRRVEAERELQPQRGDAEGERHGEAGDHRAWHDVGQRQREDEEPEALIAQRRQQVVDREARRARAVGEPPQRRGGADAIGRWLAPDQ